MFNRTQYERRILQELQELPEEALPKVIRWLVVLKEEWSTPKPNTCTPRDTFDHQTTQQLLATSSGNWARELVEEDRSERI